MDQSGVKPRINGRYDLREVDRRVTLCLEHIVTVGLEYLQMHRHTKETHFYLTDILHKFILTNS